MPISGFLLFPALSSDTTVTVWEYVWEWKVGYTIIGSAGGWKEEWAGTAVGYVDACEILHILSTSHRPGTMPNTLQAQSHSY